MNFILGLKKIGLSEYESKIYEALLKIGRTDAKEIARVSCVPPTAVYPNLKSLEKKGFVQKFDGEIKFFQAIEPKKALESFTEFRIHELNFDKVETLKELEIVNAPEKEYDPIKLSYGKETSVEILLEQGLKAKKHVYVAGWRFSKSKKAQQVISQIKKIKDNKIDVKIIFNGHNEITDFVSKELKKIGVKVKFFEIGNFSILVFDENVCKISLKNKDRTQRINILLEDKDLAKAMNEYFLILWKRAKE